jgi:hypothetical protein
MSPAFTAATRLTVMMILIVLSFAQADDKPTDWPVFRGDALQTGVAASSLPDNLEILWKSQTKDSIEGAPAIVGTSMPLI